MIPAAFSYERAGSVDEAIELLGRDEDAKVLAGGHSLLPAMKLRISRPTVLVDIGRLDDLRYVREDGDRIAIGALTRHAALVRDPMLAARCAAGPADGGADRRPAGSPPRHDRRLRRPRRSGLRPRRRGARARRGARRTRARRRAHDSGGRVLHGAVHERARAPGAAHGDTRSERRPRRVPQASAVVARLGDRRRGGSRRRRSRPGGARKHGPDVASGECRRGGAGEWGLRCRRRGASGRGNRRRRATSAPAASTGHTSHECSCGGRSSSSRRRSRHARRRRSGTDRRRQPGRAVDCAAARVERRPVVDGRASPRHRDPPAGGDVQSAHDRDLPEPRPRGGDRRGVRPRVRAGRRDRLGRDAWPGASSSTTSATSTRATSR